MRMTAHFRSRKAGPDLRRAAQDDGHILHAGRVGPAGQAQGHAGGDEGRRGGRIHRARVVIQKEFFSRSPKSDYNLGSGTTQIVLQMGAQAQVGAKFDLQKSPPDFPPRPIQSPSQSWTADSARVHLGGQHMGEQRRDLHCLKGRLGGRWGCDTFILCCR